jgi:hypothetical protein
MDVQISKEEFKSKYMKYGQPNSGWTEDYWNQFFELEQDKSYFFQEPESPAANRMMIVSGDRKHRMIFLTEDSEESFFTSNH